MNPLPELTPDEREVYSWQLDVPGFGEEGQRRLKQATVLISRVGGLGGVVAYELAAAGVGRMILAHGGNLKPSDLNRQLLMTHDWLGRPRVECAARRLRELNPRLEVIAVPENLNDENAGRWVSEADLVVDCAPLFEERYAMNAACVRLGRPMVECAMRELEAHITTFIPGRTGCLRCLCPEPPGNWTRRFPVFGAVSGTVGCIAAMETIKVLTGLGNPLANRLLQIDLRQVNFRELAVTPDPACPVCGGRAALG
jgi:molybdopterin/thiamine biosynthesis adenylyltransferase